MIWSAIKNTDNFLKNVDVIWFFVLYFKSEAQKIGQTASLKGKTWPMYMYDHLPSMGQITLDGIDQRLFLCHIPFIMLEFTTLLKLSNKNMTFWDSDNFVTNCVLIIVYFNVRVHRFKMNLLITFIS